MNSSSIKNSAPTIQQQEEYYDKRWCEDRKEQNWLSVERDNNILKYVKRTGIKNPKILDFGCGAGFLSSKLAKFSDVTAIDLSRKAVERLRQKFPNIKVLYGDVLKLDLEENSFDLVVSEEVIEHINDQSEYLRRANKYLKNGGYLILTTPNKVIVDKYVPSWSDQLIENLLDERTLRALLARYFRIEKLTTIIFEVAGHTGWLRILNSARLCRVLNCLRLSFIIPYLREITKSGLHFMVVARKINDKSSQKI